MDDEEADLGYVSYPWSWKAFGAGVSAFVSQVASATEELAAHVAIMLAAARNHESEQQAFSDAIRNDIESLTQEE